MTCPFGINISKLLIEYNKLLKGKTTALGIDCANGSNSIYLQKLGFNVTAIDKKYSRKIYEQ